MPILPLLLLQARLRDRTRKRLNEKFLHTDRGVEPMARPRLRLRRSRIAFQPGPASPGAGAERCLSCGDDRNGAPTDRRVRRFHWSTLVGAVSFSLAALLLLGPVVVAVLLLRCCDDSTGPGPAAWALLWSLLAALALLAALLGGLIARLLRRLLARARAHG